MKKQKLAILRAIYIKAFKMDAMSISNTITLRQQLVEQLKQHNFSLFGAECLLYSTRAIHLVIPGIYVIAFCSFSNIKDYLNRCFKAANTYNSK